MSYAFYLPTKFIFTAVIVDVVLRDPVWFPHPVRLIGRVITSGERRLHTGVPWQDVIGGALLVVGVLILSVAATWLLIVGLETISWLFGALAAVLIAWTKLISTVPGVYVSLHTK